jgi:hypothetical protein
VVLGVGSGGQLRNGSREEFFYEVAGNVLVVVDLPVGVVDHGLVLGQTDGLNQGEVGVVGGTSVDIMKVLEVVRVYQ